MSEQMGLFKNDVPKGTYPGKPTPTPAESRDAHGKEASARAALWIEEPQRLAWCAAWGRTEGAGWLIGTIEMRCETGGVIAFASNAKVYPSMAEAAEAALPHLLRALATWNNEEVRRLRMAVRKRMRQTWPAKHLPGRTVGREVFPSVG